MHYRLLLAVTATILLPFPKISSFCEKKLVDREDVLCYELDFHKIFETMAPTEKHPGRGKAENLYGWNPVEILKATSNCYYFTQPLQN